LLARIRVHLELRRLRAGLERQAADLQMANEQLRNEITDRKRADELLGNKITPNQAQLLF